VYFLAGTSATVYATAKPVITALAVGATSGYVAIPSSTLYLVIAPAGTVLSITATTIYSSAALPLVGGEVRTVLIVDPLLSPNLCRCTRARLQQRRRDQERQLLLVADDRAGDRGQDRDRAAPLHQPRTRGARPATRSGPRWPGPAAPQPRSAPVIVSTCTSNRRSLHRVLAVRELGLQQTHASVDMAAACAGLPYGLSEAIRQLQESGGPCCWSARRSSRTRSAASAPPG